MRVGEVVEASTVEFRAQCYKLESSPPFGSLVRAGDGRVDIYGFVCHTATSSLDPGRRVSARGADETSEDALFDNNPELSALLRTEFRVLIGGFRDHGRVVHRLPSHPPRLHGFVYQCDAAETRAFTERVDFLTALLATNGAAPTDELIGAALRHAATARDGDRDYLVAAGKRLASMLGGEIQRLGTILRVARA